ncbi:MAG: UTP--glucose-1-phosphate uridylyltransferase GalU [Clostridiales bacterium]|nr:UTP--glucose-1-phosphate uridylyltransferase GalU [Clostridiales bacterium]MCF8022911.1 UTP--glucose-1-phosphate uridylyltransferase GalU [Clostridiales bacterium]
MKKVQKVVIPAAGLGTRFLPATKAQPKEMLPVIDTPTIQYIIEEAVNSGIKDILIITGKDKNAIEDHFDKSPTLENLLRSKGKHELLEQVKDISQLVDIYYVRQKEPRGLGDAVYRARKFIGDEPFAVMLGDDVVRSSKPCLKQMLDLYEETGGSIIGIKEVPGDQVDKYGILNAECVKDKVYRCNDLVEKPAPAEAPSRLAIMGRYIIQPQVFNILARTSAGAGGEIQLTDALKELARKDYVYGYEFEGYRYDVGDKLGYLKATVELALERPDIGEEFSTYLKNIISKIK